MLGSVVPWRSVSCDNLQDGSVELLRVCKGLAVQKSLETVHRWREEGGWWCGSSRQQNATGSEINIFSNKKIFCVPKL